MANKTATTPYEDTALRNSVKERLEAYLKRKDECARLSRRIRDKREDMRYLKAVVSDGTARHGSEITDNVERAVELMDGLVNYYTALVVQREIAERRVLELLRHVPGNDAHKVMYLHYIEGLRFDEIPREMNLSVRTVFARHKQGLDAICQYVALTESGDGAEHALSLTESDDDEPLSVT